MHTFLFNVRASASGNLAIRYTAFVRDGNKDILFKYNAVKNITFVRIIEIYLTLNSYQPFGESKMKGKTVCPNCKESFVIDLPQDDKKHEITCPNCKNKFSVKTNCDGKTEKECSWEEYGEPRKTILSSIKPKTKKPFIAIVLLIIIFSVGVTTAVFSETFIESSLEVASGIGFTGEVRLHITDQNNDSLEHVIILLDGKQVDHQSNGTYYKNGIEPGIQTIQLKGIGFKDQKIELLVMPFVTTESDIKMQDGTGSEETVYFDNIGCSIILMIFSIFALISMIACMKRQHLDLAAVGSFLAIFSFGFFFVGSVLSIIAFVLIILSRDEFENGNKGKIF